MPHNKFRFPKSMRFNKQELITLASQPSQKFDKEGILIIKEKQDGFFRRTESIKVEQVTKSPKEGKRETLRSLSCVGVTGKVSLERWCRLRGNLLFYLRGPEQWSEPLGAIVLEQCTVRAAPQDQCGHWPFQIVWDGGFCYKMAAITESDRVGWLQAIQLATYECMKSQMLALQDRLEKRRGPDPDMDIHMWRIQRGQTMDISEVPLCELSLSCDNLLCDAHGRPPSPLLVIHVKSQSGHWIRYAATEVMETSSNPSYLSTVSFRASDGLNGDTLIRVTAYDMRERVSQTAVPMGFATVLLSTIQDTQRLRIALTNRENQTVGFLTLNGWSLEPSTQNASPNHCVKNGTNGPASMDTPQKKHSHRRSQSLPPRLGVKLKLPSHGAMLKQVCANVHQVTYRFHSGLGGDITVHELMAESKLCFNMPQQLLGIFIQREKELLQEVICMGELGGSWKARQMELLDTHLSLLKHYSHARQSLQMFLQATNGKYFKESSRKGDINLEFAPVNLHLQRMWVHNDTLNKSGFYDLVTVGAFTAHSHKAGKSGGLIRLVQQLKDIPTTRTSLNCPSASRVQMACDAVQAIKQLRGEVVNIMRNLLSLAKCKQSKGMMPLAEEMITKTRILLSLWDPGLVEEALSFIDTHKVTQVVHEDMDLDVGSAGRNKKRPQILSPFKRLTEQLSMLDLKSPELEDFATPSTPSNNGAVWPTHDSKISSSVPNVNKMLNNFQSFNNQKNQGGKLKDHESELKFYNDHFKNEANTLAGLNDFHSMTFHKTEPDNSPIHIPISSLYSRSNEGSDSKESSKSSPIMVQKNRNDPLPLKLEDGSYSLENTGSVSSLSLGKNEGSFEEHCEVFPLSLEDHGSSILCNSDEGCQWKQSMIDPQELSLCSDNVIRQFLDVAAMANSPSANYYQPTDEPEPWDLTQLNVEASVMCLVSKVKFLCGRCGSPAVRLRGQRAIIPGANKNNLKLSLRGHGNDKNVVTNQPVIGYMHTIQTHTESEETKCLLQTKGEMQGESDNSKKTGRTEDDNALTSAKTRRNAAIDADKALNNAVDSVQKVVKKGNKFTDGLTLSELSDWASELRPAMRKLRQAMDGLLKSGRLAHAVLRLRGETAQRARAAAALQIRRDTCFSQALTAVTTGLLCWLWSTDPEIVSELLKAGLGPLCCLEGLLSLYGNEVAMWGDMVVAIEDLQTVLFTLSRWNHSTTLAPQVTGSRGSLNVVLPVLDSLYSMFPTKQPITFTLTAVFFNVGINEKATVAEALGETVPQERSNSDNFDRLNKYYHKYKKIIIPSNSANVTRASSKVRPLEDVMENLRIAIQKKVPKNVDILQLASNACRQMNGIRVTSCKSAKDRTAMSCTLEQCMILSNEYHLAEHEFNKALDCMRSEGCRRENTYKNTGVRKYAFNKVQLMVLPKLYRPPPGTYGSVQT